MIQPIPKKLMNPLRDVLKIEHSLQLKSQEVYNTILIFNILQHVEVLYFRSYQILLYFLNQEREEKKKK